MRKDLRAFFLSLLCCMSPALSAEVFYENSSEFAKIDVEYRTKTAGVIWAHRCKDCLPIRFMFDDRTIVELLRFKTRLGVEELKGADGLPALVTWKPNTKQVLRVLPMGY